MNKMTEEEVIDTLRQAMRERKEVKIGFKDGIVLDRKTVKLCGDANHRWALTNYGIELAISEIASATIVVPKPKWVAVRNIVGGWWFAQLGNDNVLFYDNEAACREYVDLKNGKQQATETAL